MVLHKVDVQRLPVQREMLLRRVYLAADANPNTFVDLKSLVGSMPVGGHGGIDFF